MSSWIGYRQPKSAGGGVYNGYSTPRARQDWRVGEIVRVGFVRDLEVIKKVGRSYVLWQAANNRFYSFQPHLGLSRCETLSEALAA